MGWQGMGAATQRGGIREALGMQASLASHAGAAQLPGNGPSAGEPLPLAAVQVGCRPTFWNCRNHAHVVNATCFTGWHHP